ETHQGTRGPWWVSKTRPTLHNSVPHGKFQPPPALHPHIRVEEPTHPAEGGRPMRISFVLPCFDLTGGNRVVSIYAEAVRRRGHEVLAVAPQPRRPTWRQIARSLLRGRGWPARHVAGPSHFDRLDVPHRTLAHAGPVTDADLPDADVVVATWWETA